MADDRDVLEVDAVLQAGLGKDVTEAVDDRVQVGDPDAPDGGKAWIVPPDAIAAGVQVGGLHHDESGGGPSIDQRLVAVHRPCVAMGEHDDWQTLTRQRSGDLHRQLEGAAGCGNGDWLDRDDPPVGVVGRHG